MKKISRHCLLYTSVTEKNGVKLEGMEAEDAAKEVVKLIYDAKIL